MRAGPRGIASQFSCASATAGEATSKTVTRLAVQGAIPPPSAPARACHRIQYELYRRMFALIMHLITWRSQRQHLSRRPQSLIPAALSVHLPTQFAALSSHRQCCASEGELRSTPVPMSAIAKKRCRVMIGPPEKGAGRSNHNLSPGLNPASVARMSESDIREFALSARFPHIAFAHAGYLLPADLPEAQGQSAARGMRPIGTTGKSVKPVQSHRKKYSASRATQINAITPRISSTKGALATSRTRGEMRWTRMALADVRRLTRTAKSCGSGAAVLALSLREASFSRATVARKPFTGESTK